MTASWSAAYAPHGSPASSGPADWPALRWSIAIIWYCPAYAVSGLIAAISHSGTLDRIPPGASVSTGNPVPCAVYQIFASPRPTYGTPVSSRPCDPLIQPMTGPAPAWNPPATAALSPSVMVVRGGGVAARGRSAGGVRTAGVMRGGGGGRHGGVDQVMHRALDGGLGGGQER